MKVAFPDIHFSDPESISQRLTRNPKFGEWNFLTIVQERNEANKFKFYASLNGAREIRTTNRNASVIKNIEISACFNESQPMRGQIKDFIKPIMLGAVHKRHFFLFLHIMKRHLSPYRMEISGSIFFLN